MRYYSINLMNTQGTTMVQNPGTGLLVPDTTGAAGDTWRSHPNGLFDLAALNIELDIPQKGYGAFQSNINLRIWGPGLRCISQANQLANYGINIYAGMLPPYNLNQSAIKGLVAAGQVFQGFGNWEGVNQYLELVIANAGIYPDARVDLSFQWKQGQSLQAAIQSTLNRAWNKATYNFQIGNYSTTGTKPATYSTLEAFSSAIMQMTSTPNSPGVQIHAHGIAPNVIFHIFDYNTVNAPITLNFADFIGQPTWISAAEVSFATVMRGDLNLGSTVIFPPAIISPYAIITPDAAFPGAPATNSLAFIGTFSITEIHHFGNYRQADASAWRTQYTCVPVSAIIPQPSIQAISNYGDRYA